MAELTKERIEYYTRLPSQPFESGASVFMYEVREMARQLLASMEQEPVAWLLSGGGAKNDVRFDSSNAYADPLRDVTPLYAAQQVTSVQEQVPESLKDRLLTICDLVEDNDEYCQDIWNACRAAMLQGKADGTLTNEGTRNHPEDNLDMVDHSGDPNEKGNSPVTQDTWIPVSERMPPNKPGSYEYIVFESLNNRAHHDYWNVPDGSCDDFSPFWNHYGKYVTHWMPLPAAP